MLQIYNTITRKKEEFVPLSQNKVKIYNCGPTVYDSVHIGNLRTFVMNDLLKRVFIYNGYEIEDAMNITDVDDKTIRRSVEENISLSKLTRKYEELFLLDIDSLNILHPKKILRASENILDMIDFVDKLIKKGVAYQSKDGVYLSIGMIKNYGDLARIKLDQKTISRTNNDEYEKENPRDFALWKFYTKEDGEAVWEAPFGNGRPGWHIECSTMAIKALGPTIDIHTGGSDLIFPHHTNEIAQSEALTEKQYVKYWVHGGFMNVNDEKMSKSKNNFLRLEDIKKEGISPLSYRYWLMTSHYRSQINFSMEALKGAQQALLRLARHVVEWNDEEEKKETKKSNKNTATTDQYTEKFKSIIQDDIDIPNAIALMWNMIKDISLPNKEKLKIILDMDKVFGLGLDLLAKIKHKEAEMPLEIKTLGEAREEARKNKEWQKADALRKEIEERGYEIIDVNDGFKIREK